VQEVQAVRTAGAIIQDRYVVEELLGKGGFSAVYLVRDQQDGDKKFALKELIDHDRKERNRFTFECKLLQSLSHPALPRVYGVSENGDQVHMLMEYIEGPNLEILRKQQPGIPLPLSRALTILEPIMDAVDFLHKQKTPIIHRDIKPANIIVPTAGGKSVLVDFGIAKEYNLESTTTAIRHCSPGYGAPEQYSTGTDLRTDIYGLGATLYALLTGIVPIDAFLRATKLAGKGEDPLVPIQQVVPGLPSHVANAIHRAMSINGEARFASADEFWQALQQPFTPQRTLKSLFAPGSWAALRGPERSTGPITTTPQKSFRTSKIEIGLLSFLAVSIIIGVVLSIGYYRVNSQITNTASAPQHAIVGGVILTPPPTTNSSVYPNVVGPYGGTIHDLLNNATTDMTLTGIVQSNSSVNGYFIGLHADGPFTGVLDTSRHLLFTVKSSDPGKLPLFFEGTVRPDGNLVGNYCSQDKAGQCVGDYGLWSVKSVPAA